MSTRLTYSPGNHTYFLADEQGKKRRVPSVSSLKKCLHSFEGERWHIDETAGAVTDRWDELADVAPPLRREEILRLGLAAVAVPRDFGTAVHHYCEQLWTGEQVEVPERYAAHVQAVAEWFRRERVRVAYAERLCWADAGDFGEGPMAGRFDLIVEHPTWGLGLLDLKSWQAGRSGKAKPAEWAFQLAAYAAMEWMVADGDDTPFPAVRWCGILHVGPTGAVLYTLPPDDWKRANDQVDAARALKALPAPTMEKNA